MDKLNLLTTKFPELIRSADPNVKPVFGKMNLQQMVEHMSDAVRNANGKLSFELLTPPERVEAMQSFVRSEKEFKPNTKNVLLGEEPEPVKNKDLSFAIEEYEMEIKDFLDYICSVASPFSISFRMRPNLGDEADNMFVELAFASNSNFLITSNFRDYTIGNNLLFDSFKVITPTDFARMWRKFYV